MVLTDSGTSALALALALSVRPEMTRPLVALPAYACPDIGTAAIAAGFPIVLYDVNPDTLEPELASVTQCLQAGATHVVVTHLFGWILDPHPITMLAEAYGAVVIEDAAQHAGGRLRGVRGGALCEWSVLSFGRGKGLNAGGGGALLRRGSLPVSPVPEQDSPRVEALTGVAKAAAAQLLTVPWLYWVPGSIPALGLGATEFHAAQTVGSMATWSALLLADALQYEAGVLKARRVLETGYWEALGTQHDLVLRRPPAHMVSGALRFPVRLPAGVADTFRQFGVARSYPRTLLAYPEIAARCQNADHAFPGAQQLAESLYTLPTHARVSAKMFRAIVKGLQQPTDSRARRGR